MNVEVGTILIANSPTTKRENLLASGIKVIEKQEKGVKVERIHPCYNGETFFLTFEALDKSNWVLS